MVSCFFMIRKRVWTMVFLAGFIFKFFLDFNTLLSWFLLARCVGHAPQLKVRSRCKKTAFYPPPHLHFLSVYQLILTWFCYAINLFIVKLQLFILFIFFFWKTIYNFSSNYWPTEVLMKLYKKALNPIKDDKIMWFFVHRFTFLGSNSKWFAIYSFRYKCRNAYWGSPISYSF